MEQGQGRPLVGVALAVALSVALLLAAAPNTPPAGSAAARGSLAPAPVVKEIIVRGDAPAVAAGRPDVVAFTSGGTGLPGDRRGLRDVYVRVGARVTRLSRPLRGFTAGHADQPAISADGSAIAYRMTLRRKGGDEEPAPRIVLADRRSGRTRPLVAGPYLDQQQPAISPDGGVVAFVARRHPGEALQVFAVDVADGTTSLVSRNGPAAGDGPSTGPAVSHGGRVIAFSSLATNLAGDSDANGISDVYVVRQAMTPDADPPLRISDAGAAQPADGPSRAPSISDDGRVVAFESFAANLVAGDTNATMDVFVRDLATGAVTMVSASPERSAGDGPSREPAVSGDGRYVAFTSGAANLLGGPPPRRRPRPTIVDAQGWVARTPADRVYARDLVQARTVRASPASGASASTGGEPAISTDGRFVSFSGGARLRVVRHRDLLATTTGPAMLRFDTDDLLQTVVVTNSGFGRLQPGRARLSGPGAKDYWVASNTCQGISVAPGRSCFVIVGLNQNQGAAGARHAALQVEADRSLDRFDQVELLSGSLVTRAIHCGSGSVPVLGCSPEPPFDPCAPVFVTTSTTPPIVTTTAAPPVTTTTSLPVTTTTQETAVTTTTQGTLSLSGARLAGFVATIPLCPEITEPEPEPTTTTSTTLPPTTTTSTTRPPTTTTTSTTLPPTTTTTSTTLPPTTTTTSTTLPPTTTTTSTTLPPEEPPPPAPDTIPPPTDPQPPRLSVSPPLGEPGKVTMATGTNYPPNTDVRLSWDRGIGTKVVRTDANGRFRTPVLIFHKDRLGMRVLTGAAESASATADFQVVPGTLIPGDFLIRR